MGKANAKPELGNYTFDQDFARRELGNMIILHEYPLSIVDHVGFRRYSSALQPLFKIPTRNTVKSDITNIYEHEREQVMKLLEGIRSRVAITTDLWTSDNQKKGFMAVTGHFIDEEFILQSRILRQLVAYKLSSTTKTHFPHPNPHQPSPLRHQVKATAPSQALVIYHHHQSTHDKSHTCTATRGSEGVFGGGSDEGVVVVMGGDI
ncbi:hypothetical protein RJ639_045903 [Escallonia herrerae]|uniref:Uncharacterized protein n=1 Tax=Escallonia herrerae TaxID=1293975 RepID=A0AA88W7Q7_9ASTE|nr:hypothetical protein RJ639_045903 [Escallonia herrerae]